MFRPLYKRYVRAPALDRLIRRALDVTVNMYARCAGLEFPANYIRHWKYDMLRGRYERETVQLFRNILKSGMTVIDIGAHIGYFTRLFSTLVGPTGKVLAFEADPENYALLEKNTRGLCNVACRQLAITDKKGKIDFYHYDDKSGAHSTLPNVPLPFAKRKLVIPATDLDLWIASKDIQNVDIIKMDIEGGESAALHGMKRTLSGVRALVTEFAPAWIEAAGSTPLAFLLEIESRGFSLHAISQDGLVPFSPARSGKWRSLLPRPKTGSHHGEFVNLYCVKELPSYQKTDRDARGPMTEAR